MNFWNSTQYVSIKDTGHLLEPALPTGGSISALAPHGKTEALVFILNLPASSSMPSQYS